MDMRRKTNGDEKPVADESDSELNAGSDSEDPEVSLYRERLNNMIELGEEANRRLDELEKDTQKARNESFKKLLEAIYQAEEANPYNPDVLGQAVAALVRYVESLERKLVLIIEVSALVKEGSSICTLLYGHDRDTQARDERTGELGKLAAKVYEQQVNGPEAINLAMKQLEIYVNQVLTSEVHLYREKLDNMIALGKKTNRWLDQWETETQNQRNESFVMLLDAIVEAEDADPYNPDVFGEAVAALVKYINAHEKRILAIHQKIAGEVSELVKQGALIIHQIHSSGHGKDKEGMDKRTNKLVGLAAQVHELESDGPEATELAMKELKIYVNQVLVLQQPEVKKENAFMDELDRLNISGLDKIAEIIELKNVSGKSYQQTLVQYVEIAKSSNNTESLEKFLKELDFEILEYKINNLREVAKTHIELIVSTEEKSENQAKIREDYNKKLNFIPENVYTTKILEEIQKLVKSFEAVLLAKIGAEEKQNIQMSAQARQDAERYIKKLVERELPANRVDAQEKYDKILCQLPPKELKEFAKSLKEQLDAEKRLVQPKKSEKTGKTGKTTRLWGKLFGPKPPANDIELSSAEGDKSRKGSPSRSRSGSKE